MESRRTFLERAAALPLAAQAHGQPRRPNILLLFPDQWRPDWTGANPHLPVRTPVLDALSKRGMRFTRAVVASPLCAPSRACLASGKEYGAARVPSNAYDYPLDQRTVYAMLRDSGYHTMACGKVDLHKKTQDWGLDGKRLLKEWGFSDGVDNAGKHDAVNSGRVAPKDPYMAFLHKRHLAHVHVEDLEKRKGYSATFPTPLPDEAYCDNWLAKNGVDLLRAAPAGKPWFLQVNFTGPHSPMDITASMEKRWRGAKFPQPNRCTQFTPEIHVAIRQNYSAMCENIDRWCGLLLDEVRRRGELDNTLVVFSSDHGEMLGDHDRWGKSVPWQPSVGVPLTIAGPGVKRGVSDALVSHIDLTATFLECAGLAVPKDMDSRTLKPLLAGATRSHRDYVLSGLDPWRMVWDGRHKLVRGFGNETQLFDHDADPLENDDRAAADPKTVARLEPLLSATWGRL